MATGKAEPKAKRKAPRWENENLVWESPDPEKVQCKDCIWRAEDRKFPSGAVIYGSTLGLCKVLEVKPDSILENKEECPYYLKG